MNETLKKNEAKIQEIIEQIELKMKELRLDTENTMREMMFESDKRMAKIEGFMENLLKTPNCPREGEGDFGGDVYTPPHQ